MPRRLYTSHGTEHSGCESPDMLKMLFCSPSLGQRLVLLTTCLWFFRDFAIFFGPYTSACISGTSSGTYPVFAYSVVLFHRFRMVPVSCSSGGTNKNVLRKTAPLFREARLNRPCTTASTGQAVRGCNLIRGIWMVDT